MQQVKGSGVVSLMWQSTRFSRNYRKCLAWMRPLQLPQLRKQYFLSCL